MSLFRLSTNTTQSVFFEKYYKGYVSENGESNLAIASSYREKVVTVMKNIQQSRKSLPMDIVETLRDYLPYISTMCSQLAAAEYLKVRKNPVINWSSALSPRREDAIAVYTYTSLSDECASAYVLYGMCHYQNAWFILDGETKEDEADPTYKKDNITRSKEATDTLRRAAGIFYFIANDLIPHLRLSAIRAPDLWVPNLKALSLMSLANAQERGLFLSIEKGSSNSLLAKLCLGLAAKFDEAHTVGDVGKDLMHMNRDFPTYLRTKSQYYAAHARKYLGMDANEKGRYGDRVVFHRLAVEIMNHIVFHDTDNPGLLRHMCRCEDAKKELEELYKEAKEDNDGAYFDIVPEPQDLVFPEGAFVIKMIPYEPDSLLESNFFDTNPDKSKCVIS